VPSDNQLYVTDRDDWRSWLREHHAAAREVWLVFFKKATGTPSIPYEDSVEEALCFGWIDSLIKNLDGERYARKFTPRTATAVWSADNKRRVEKLLQEGRMTEAGRRIIDEAKQNGSWDRVPESRQPWEMPPEFEAALAADTAARENFEKLAPSHRKQYIAWIASARRSETRVRRSQEAVSLLARNEKLGLK